MTEGFNNSSPFFNEPINADALPVGRVPRGGKKTKRTRKEECEQGEINCPYKGVGRGEDLERRAVWMQQRDV